MAAYSTGANWSFPEDLPGGWVKVEEQDNIQDKGLQSGSIRRRWKWITTTKLAIWPPLDMEGETETAASSKREFDDDDSEKTRKKRRP